MSETKDKGSSNSMLNGEHWQDVKELVGEKKTNGEPQKRSYLSVLTEPLSIAIILLLFFTVILPAITSFISLM